MQINSRRFAGLKPGPQFCFWKNLFRISFQAGNAIEDLASVRPLTLPVLIQHGSLDIIVKPDCSRHMLKVVFVSTTLYCILCIGLIYFSIILFAEQF